MKGNINFIPIGVFTIQNPLGLPLSHGWGFSFCFRHTKPYEIKSHYIPNLRPTKEYLSPY